jgi:hypothetical protein
MFRELSLPAARFLVVERIAAMEHIAAILLLIGCADDGRSCVEIPAPRIGYETEQACEEDVPYALRQAGDKRPLVLAKCIPVDPLAEGDMEIIWDVNGRGELVATVVPYNDDIAAGTAIAGLDETDKAARLR